MRYFYVGAISRVNREKFTLRDNDRFHQAETSRRPKNTAEINASIKSSGGIKTSRPPNTRRSCGKLHIQINLGTTNQV